MLQTPLFKVAVIDRLIQICIGNGVDLGAIYIHASLIQRDVVEHIIDSTAVLTIHSKLILDHTGGIRDKKTHFILVVINAINQIIGNHRIQDIVKRLLPGKDGDNGCQRYTKHQRCQRYFF